MIFIGLMSGTSLDGIDAAIIKTDGERIYNYGPTLYQAYSKNFSSLLYNLVNNIEQPTHWLDIEKELTLLHAQVVKELLVKANLKSKDITALGFHGQTIIHRPLDNITWQIGNGALLCEISGINVVNDFRRRDVARGGSGAPLVPIFHQVLLKDTALPAAIINIGGISNITSIDSSNTLRAFDCGPANAIINDACQLLFNTQYDENGNLASQGNADDSRVDKWLKDEFFKQNLPKSLDRNHFKQLSHSYVQSSSNKYNIIATLTKFTALAVIYAIQNTLNIEHKIIYLAGGGSKNSTLVSYIRSALKDATQVLDISELKIAGDDDISINADYVEAQAFAYLAARSLKKLPISFSTTTGVKSSVTGGVHHYFK